jgi:hypothetical protein
MGLTNIGSVTNELTRVFGVEKLRESREKARLSYFAKIQNGFSYLKSIRGAIEYLKINPCEIAGLINDFQVIETETLEKTAYAIEQAVKEVNRLHNIRLAEKEREQVLKLREKGLRLHWYTDFEAAKNEVRQMIGIEVAKTRKKPRQNAEFRAIMPELVKYFTGHPDAKYEHLNGLYLYGESGGGKSLIMRVFQKFASQHYSVAFSSCEMPVLVSEMKTGQFGGVKELLNFGNAYFDDLALSSPIIHQINVVTDTIFHREKVWQSDCRLTHFSANYDIDGLKQFKTLNGIPFFSNPTLRRIRDIATEIEIEF